MALGAVKGRSAVPTLPLVADALLNPEPRHAELLGTDLEGLRRDGRQVALELRRLVHGPGGQGSSPASSARKTPCSLWSDKASP